MKEYIKQYKEFMKISFNFMAPRSKAWVIIHGWYKAHKAALDMCKWAKLTPEQREAWYLSGEGRLLEF